MKNNELYAKFERNNNSLRIDFKNQKKFFVEK